MQCICWFPFNFNPVILMKPKKLSLWQSIPIFNYLKN